MGKHFVAETMRQLEKQTRQQERDEDRTEREMAFDEWRWNRPEEEVRTMGGFQ